ncbi:MAG: TspO/MBR family protein [Parvicellaceae bacterium]
MIFRVLIFLLVNFSALAIGGYFTGDGVPSDWYTNLSKAPWTPPGWVFGAAWSTIMICFSFFMSYAWKYTNDRNFLIVLFTIQIILNIGWNPTFFYFHQVLLGLIVISILTLLIAYILYYYWKVLKLKSILIFPYLLWLIIATSLNAYVLFNN